jgi:hypothetical protein
MTGSRTGRELRASYWVNGELTRYTGATTFTDASNWLRHLETYFGSRV